MDLQNFRQIVDSAASGIAACEGDLQRLYDYVGLEHGAANTHSAVSDALYAQIRDCFSSGNSAVWRLCKDLRKDLIREHILSDARLDPYFEVLDHLQDAVRIAGDALAPIEGDWGRAVRITLDHIHINSWGTENREKTYARDFTVAHAARALRYAGFAIRLEPGQLRLEEAAETTLIATIEDLVATMGGINVARRIFASISPQYDVDQQRYHVVRHVSQTGEGVPQIPWGYLIQLAAKHAQRRTPNANTDAQWEKLCGLSRAFAAVIDVQPYAPTFYGSMDANTIVPLLQEMAVYDSLFRIPQMRPRDVVKVARGIFSWLDTSASMKAGWSIDQVLEIIGYLLDPARDARGPIFVDEADIGRACPTIPRRTVAQILDEMLCHPHVGTNRNFTRPTDAPIAEHADLKKAGHDFFLRPLLHQSGRSFCLLDRSVCAPAFLEGVMHPASIELHA